jgi:uncharacterized membrane protein
MVHGRRTEFAVFCMLLILSGLGAALRLVKLDDKEFWHDECFTALVLSGHTTSQLKDQISVRPVPMSELTKFRAINETSSVASLIHVIGEDEPGHAPCFYLIEYMFCTLFGTAPFTMRLAAVIISIATLPLIFWLAIETYKERTLAALATATAALSPCLIYYAQEARDYSLGILFMTVSTASLFYALRNPKRQAWIGYALSLVAGLYSWLFITIVIGGHLVYVALSQGRRTEVWRPFILSLASAGLLFAPWMMFLSQHTANFKKAYDWIQPSLSQAELFIVWSAIPYKAFALFGFKTARLAPLLLLVTIIESAAVVLATIPIRNRKYMYLSIIGVWLVVFAGQDLVSGGARSAVFRYQTVIIFGILMLFPTLVEWLWKRNRVAKSAALMTIALIFGVELLSDSYMLHCKIWPDKAIRLRFTQPIAQRLNKEPAAALVAEEQSINPTELLDLSYVVHPDCQLIFRNVKVPQPIPKNTETLYLWNPSSELEKELQPQYEITDNVDNFPYLKRAHLKSN